MQGTRESVPNYPNYPMQISSSPSQDQDDSVHLSIHRLGNFNLLGPWYCFSVTHRTKGAELHGSFNISWKILRKRSRKIMFQAEEQGRSWNLCSFNFITSIPHFKCLTLKLSGFVTKSLSQG